MVAVFRSFVAQMVAVLSVFWLPSHTGTCLFTGIAKKLHWRASERNTLTLLASITNRRRLLRSWHPQIRIWSGFASSHHIARASFSRRSRKRTFCCIGFLQGALANDALLVQIRKDLPRTIPYLLHYSGLQSRTLLVMTFVLRNLRIMSKNKKITFPR